MSKKYIINYPYFIIKKQIKNYVKPTLKPTLKPKFTLSTTQRKKKPITPCKYTKP